MLANKKQLSVAKAKIARLSRSLAEQPADNFIDLRVRDDHLNLMAEIQAEIDEFDSIYGKGIDAIAIERLEDVRHVPRRIRLGLKMSREQFAKKINIDHRRLVRWESTGYSSVKLSDIEHIFREFGLEFARPNTLVVKNADAPQK